MGQLVTGAHAFVYVNANPFGVTTDFSWVSEETTKPIYAVDQVEAFELAQETASVVATMTIWRRPALGGAEGAGMTTQFENLPRQKYFSVLILDRLTGLPLFAADQCKVLQQSWRIAARGLMTGSIQFRGISWSNEAPTQ